MCFGGSSPSINIPEPVAPEVKYIGPSEDDIARQQQGLNSYQDQINQQQSEFENRLNEQIAAANRETENLRTQYEADIAAQEAASAAEVSGATDAAGRATSAAGGKAAADVAAAGSTSAAQQVGAYTVTTQESEAVAPQTTAATTEKKKPKKNLKISTAGTASAAGSGLNIGV